MVKVGVRMKEIDLNVFIVLEKQLAGLRETASRDVGARQGQEGACIHGRGKTGEGRVRETLQKSPGLLVLGLCVIFFFFFRLLYIS